MSEVLLYPAHEKTPSPYVHHSVLAKGYCGFQWEGSFSQTRYPCNPIVDSYARNLITRESLLAQKLLGSLHDTIDLSLGFGV